MMVKSLQSIHPVNPEFCKRASIEAKRYIQRLDRQLLCSFDTSMERDIPLFDKSEVVLSELLGKGGFGSVYALKEITLVRDEPTDNAQHEHGSACEPCRKRTELANSVTDGGRYAVKILSPQVYEKQMHLICGANDMIAECRFLSSLEHENIVKLHGLSAAGAEGFADGVGGFFFIVDRLEESLVERFVNWHQREHPTISARFRIAMRKTASENFRESQRKFFLERLQVAHALSKPLVYLHSRKIVFRDVKPENVGFDSNDTLKLYDFGLAKVLTGNEQRMCNAGKSTGTHPYMSPEVYLQGETTLSMDVYSFGIALWEIVAVKEPFPNVMVQEYSRKVLEGGLRPRIQKGWPKAIANLIVKCWDPIPEERPTMANVRNTLATVIESLRSEGQHPQNHIDICRRIGG